MTRFLYWLVYNVDLVPLGPKLLDLAVRAWLFAHAAEKARIRFKTTRARPDWAMTPAWTHR